MGVSTVDFDSSQGWSTQQAQLAVGEVTQPMAWTTNTTPESDDEGSGWPIATLKGLASGEIVVWAAANGEVDQPELYQDSTLPLVLPEGDYLSQYENQPAPNVSRSGPIFADVGEVYVTVQIWFGDPVPSSDSFRAASDQLARLVLG
jgi:hypothetical protein